MGAYGEVALAGDEERAVEELQVLGRGDELLGLAGHHLDVVDHLAGGDGGGEGGEAGDEERSETPVGGWFVVGEKRVVVVVVRLLEVGLEEAVCRMKIADEDEGKESFVEGTVAWLYILDAPSYCRCYCYCSYYFQHHGSP